MAYAKYYQHSGAAMDQTGQPTLTAQEPYASRHVEMTDIATAQTSVELASSVVAIQSDAAFYIRFTNVRKGDAVQVVSTDDPYYTQDTLHLFAGVSGMKFSIIAKS